MPVLSAHHSLFEAFPFTQHSIWHHYFSYEKNRNHAFSKYKIKVQEPKLYLVVGSYDNVNDTEVREGCHTEFCVTVYNKKVLNSVQPWPRSFSAMCHYTKFDMASREACRSHRDDLVIIDYDTL